MYFVVLQGEPHRVDASVDKDKTMCGLDRGDAALLTWGEALRAGHMPETSGCNKCWKRV